MILHFIGQRQRDFTLDSPTGLPNKDEPGGIQRYYVEIGKPLDINPSDGKALLERDPLLWSLEPKAVEPAKESPAPAEAEPSPKPSGNKK